MPTAKRGYSLVMWVVVFALVFSATLMFIVPVKRGITAKILHTTDFALWGIWGNATQEEGGWNHNQIGAIQTNVDQHLVHKGLENEGNVRTILNARTDSTSSYSSY